MKQQDAIEAFAALANTTRLSVFQYLIANAPSEIPALKIAEAFGAKPSTLSGHLAILKHAGLVKNSRHQREIRYTVRFSAINDLIAFLLSDCCGGQVENCGEILALLEPADAACAQDSAR